MHLTRVFLRDKKNQINPPFFQVCKRPLKIYIKEFTPIARYGHDAFVSGGNMYVIGGFNGEMLNDLLKFTPGTK